MQNVKSSSSTSKINTVGIVVDESCFFQKEALVEELVANGILIQNIKLIVYKDKFKKNETDSQPIFGIKHLNWNAEITESFVNDFMNQNFDLLINYYDIEKAILLKVTNNSKAQFKVGFSSVDKRLNHLTITTNTENYPVFIHELFRYLKILNKI